MKKIVIKIGSSSLTNGTNQLSRPHMVELARQIASLHEAGDQVVVVSSGAIVSGREIFSSLPKDSSLPFKQMLASIGQVRLMHVWSDLFALYSVCIGQVLLTRGDFSNEKCAINAKNTLLTMMSHRVIPIINENDTVATEEIRVGDNDNLSAFVANLIEADLLILLTDQQGLYTADPRHYPEAKLIEIIENIDDSIANFAKGSSHADSIGTGGMATKIEAARFATQSGIPTVISSSKVPNILFELAQGKRIGTYFASNPQFAKNKSTV